MTSPRCKHQHIFPSPVKRTGLASCRGASFHILLEIPKRTLARNHLCGQFASLNFCEAVVATRPGVKPPGQGKVSKKGRYAGSPCLATTYFILTVIAWPINLHRQHPSADTQPNMHLLWNLPSKLDRAKTPSRDSAACPAKGTRQYTSSQERPATSPEAPPTTRASEQNCTVATR